MALPLYALNNSYAFSKKETGAYENIICQHSVARTHQG